MLGCFYDQWLSAGRSFGLAAGNGRTAADVACRAMGWCIGVFVSDSLSGIVRGAYSIFEPDLVWPTVTAQQLAVVLIAGWLYGKGFRLGQGWFYDTLLPTLSTDTRTVGIAFREQHVATLPRDIHDRAVHQMCWA